MTHEHGKSDRVVVPQNPSNNALERAAETEEGRARAKGNPPERNVLRTQSRVGAPSRWNTLRALRVLAWWDQGSVRREP